MKNPLDSKKHAELQCLAKDVSLLRTFCHRVALADGRSGFPLHMASPNFGQYTKTFHSYSKIDTLPCWLLEWPILGLLLP